MTEFKVGDEVRVTLEGKVAFRGSDWLRFEGSSGSTALDVRKSEVEVLTPKDDPAKAQQASEPLVVNYGDSEPDRSKTFQEEESWVIWSYQDGEWGWSHTVDSRWYWRGPFHKVVQDEFPWVEVVS